jgi:hypothetical protein
MRDATVLGPASGRCRLQTCQERVRRRQLQPPARDNNASERLTVSRQLSRPRSGKGELLPAPPPLRTVHAPFNAYGSSIEQRIREDTRWSPQAERATWTLLRQSRLPKCFRWRRPHQQRSLRPRRRFCFASYAGWLTVRVHRHQREVSPLSRGVTFSPVRPVTGRHSLSPSSFTRRPIGSPCGSLSRVGGRRAYHVASRKPAWVRPRLYAGGAASAPGEFGAPGPGHVPFGPSLSAP